MQGSVENCANFLSLQFTEISSSYLLLRFLKNEKNRDQLVTVVITFNETYINNKTELNIPQ